MEVTDAEAGGISSFFEKEEHESKQISVEALTAYQWNANHRQATFPSIIRQVSKVLLACKRRLTI